MAATAGKTLFLRNMPLELVREAKTAAARRGQTLTAIVAEALAHPNQGEELAVDHALLDTSSGDASSNECQSWMGSA